VSHRAFSAVIVAASFCVGAGGGFAAAAAKITVQSLVSDGYTVASAWMSPIGPALVLQKADKVFLCFATEKPDAADIVTNYCKPVH
jgi:hypothetical protein